jgi:peptide/nickel transport system substrate-binding protein
MISYTKLYYLAFVLFVFSCQERLEDKDAFGGKKYGGVFTYFSPEKTTVFFPLYSPTVYNQRVLSQIFEPLFILNEKAKVVPNLAKSITTSKNGTRITITLRNDVNFHANDCFSGDQKMTAEDVKFSLDFACSGNKWNSMGGLIRDKVVGGKEYYRKSKNHFSSEGVRGIKILNDTTILLELINGFNGFEKILAHPSVGVFSKKALEYYKSDFTNNPVGTGPFMMNKSSKKEILLERNVSYWKKDKFGNQLPFLKQIRIKKRNGVRAEYQAFSKKEIDIIFELPVSQLDYTFGSLEEAQKGKNLLHRIVVKKGVKINYLSFDCASYPFNNPLVRKAFSLAIDRKKICLDAMNGDGNYAINGFGPKTVYYQPNEQQLLTFDPVRAKQLLAEAGFNAQNKFPGLTFYVNAQKGTSSYNWAKEIVAQLKQNLGVDLHIKYSSLDQKYQAILSRKAKIWKSAWVPDYQDAEAYFRVFYDNKKQIANEESNYNNFNDSRFDSIYKETERVKDLKKRNQLLNMLDQILIEKAAISPIFTEDLFVIVNLRVRDFNMSSSGLIDFSKIYIKEIN